MYKIILQNREGQMLVLEYNDRQLADMAYERAQHCTLDFKAAKLY